MSKYQKECKIISSALAEFNMRYNVRSSEREKRRQELVKAELEVISRQDISHEQLLLECAERRVIMGQMAANFEDYMEAVEIIKKALEVAAPMADVLSDKQSETASKPRGIIKTIKQNLVQRFPDYTAKELWPHLFSELEKQGLSPDDKGIFYEYFYKDRTETITLKRFENVKI